MKDQDQTGSPVSTRRVVEGEAAGARRSLSAGATRSSVYVWDLRPPSTTTMVYIDSFDDFEKAAERVYLNAPMKTRCVMKYDHVNSCLKVKVTDNVVCLQYKTDSQQELKKLEKLISNLMKHMASGER